MNYQTDNVYSTIKNDQIHLERMFEGMFVIARRFIGYNPKGSSYPFTSGMRWHGDKSFKKELAFSKSKNLVILPNANKLKTSSELEYTLIVSLAHVIETNKNGFMFKVLKDIYDTAEWEGAEWIDYRDAIDVNLIAREMFNDYFEEMLEFARLKTSRTYARRWRDEVYCG